MGCFGKASVKAVQLLSSGTVKSPRDAWDKAIKIYNKNTTTQGKGCPRGAFLGLCEEGIIKGVPAGNYTDSEDNKGYALKAIQILKEAPELASNQSALWRRVLNGNYKNHNQQMDVVTSLWNNNLIED